MTNRHEKNTIKKSDCGPILTPFSDAQATQNDARSPKMTPKKITKKTSKIGPLAQRGVSCQNHPGGVSRNIGGNPPRRLKFGGRWAVNLAGGAAAPQDPPAGKKRTVGVKNCAKIRGKSGKIDAKIHLVESILTRKYLGLAVSWCVHGGKNMF